ncbi:rhodanese-like domain-containing protein [Clostridium magnum]|uniref:Thiosulfate sulfurtransferase GlpE n=1 Tax=Clostridium magnum DSM 2767 TaxID=1121326 RepID=A0A161WIL3_9CLOT|nr:rhodanese-like domain-containing protein [Clostridium magnum]KZL91525.1 thiosulfate sulfurtransferase GlpE [Clostridium magnum DSM 2767]SHH46090.1 Rhodanese-related sulfurtransferase [Clostridium magnum DSM 2767]
MFSFFNRNRVNSINVNELKDLLGRINLIDIRETYEYRSGHLPKAKNIPMSKILSEPDKYLNKDKEYYIICQSGGRSISTYRKLKAMGFNIVNVSGGTSSYKGALAR